MCVVVAGVAACGGHSAPKRATASPAATSAPRTEGEPPAHSGPTAVAASGIQFPANLAFDPRGGMWVVSGSSGTNASDGVWYVPPDGHPRHVVKGLTAALGVAWVGDRLYVGHVTTPTNGQVSVYQGFNGTTFQSHHVVLDGLPVGHSSVGSVAEGPGGRMFVNVGSPGDNSGRPGHVLSFAPGGGAAKVEATGLRSGFGLAFHGSQALVTDNGRDDLGPHRPPDELNAFEPAGPVVDFGFPHCYDQGGAACAGTRPPLAAFPAHSTLGGVAVKGDVAFVVENGSTIVQALSGGGIVRVDLRTGRRTIFWRSPVKNDPLGAAIGPDGNLYVTLYVSGKIRRFDL